jgi:hypothetical protein
MKREFIVIASVLAFQSGAALASINWREVPGVYHPVETIRTVIDEMRPSYQRERIFIETHPNWNDAEKRVRLLALDETTLRIIRTRRLRRLEAHYVRAELWRKCTGHSGGHSCDSELCRNAPSGDYYTTREWARYYRGVNISDTSMRRGTNGHMYSGPNVPLRNHGGTFCSVNISHAQSGTHKILTRVDFHYRPEFIARTVISDSDAILAGLRSPTP